jgi:hypothetical protein
MSDARNLDRWRTFWLVPPAGFEPATPALGVQFGESFNMLVWELARAYVFPRLPSIGDIYEGPADYVRTVIIC